MARCGCTAACSCVINGVLGDCINITVSGNGSLLPYEISADPVFDPATDECLNCGPSGFRLLFDPDTDDCLNCGPQGIQLVIDPNVDNQLTCGPTGLFVPFSENPFVTVAASNTPEPYKSAATFICDGIADEVEIIAALTAAQTAINNNQSPVWLLQGLFTLSATVPLLRGYLRGLGQNQTSVVGAAGIIPFTIGFLGGGAHLSDMQISSNGAACISSTGGGGSPVGIKLRQVQFVTINGLGGALGSVEITNGSEHQIEDCTFNTTSGGSTVRSIHMVAFHVLITNNTIENGSLFYQGSNSLIKDNHVSAGSLDSYTFSNCDEITVDGNYTEFSFGHGYLIDTVDDSQFVNNFTSHFDADNGGGAGAATADGFHVINSDRNQITNNYARNNPGAAFGRHGIFINGAANNDNWVTNNDLRTGNILSPFNDTGTATDITAGNRLV